MSRRFRRPCTYAVRLLYGPCDCIQCGAWQAMLEGVAAAGWDWRQLQLYISCSLSMCVLWSTLSTL